MYTISNKNIILSKRHRKLIQKFNVVVVVVNARKINARKRRIYDEKYKFYYSEIFVRYIKRFFKGKSEKFLNQ